MPKETAVKIAAKEYLSRNWSVIPCRGKIPIGAWKEFQSRRPLIKEIDAWPDDCNVGIVTGKISGLGVIDVDSDSGMAGLRKLLPANFTCPMVSTPRGGKHLYCQHTDVITNKVGKGVEGVDFRGEGGFCVAPPSGDGKYSWDSASGMKTPLPRVPELYVAAVLRETLARSDRGWTAGMLFTEGRRNSDLFHYAYHLAKGKSTEDEAFSMLAWVATRCGTPEWEVKRVLASAFERAGREERNLSAEIGKFIDVTDGSFNIKDLSNSLNIINPADKNTLRVVLHRLRKEGIIEKSGKRDGEYVRVVNEAEEIEWWKCDTSEFPLELPLGISQMASVHPGGIVAIGGVNDIGKTAFALNVAIDNIETHPIRYISSEMDGSELHSRLKKWEGVDIEEFKKVKFIQLGAGNNLGKLIDTSAVNIIDYLEAKDGEFYKMGHWISEIYDALRGKRGVAVVCMQKEKGKEYARGGSLTADKSRLYVSLDIEDRRSVCKIVKSKNFKGGHKPTGMQRYFKIVGGWKILPDGEWGFPVIGGGR